MLKLYRILTNIAAPLINLYLFKRKINGKEDLVRFKERLGFAALPRPKGQLIWIHAASVGEAVSVLPLVEKLSATYQSVNFLITTGTVTSAELVEKRLPARTIHQFVPVDRLPYVRRFLKHWQPDLAIWVESELWPNLIVESASRCRLILLNGRMSEKSYRKWKKYSGFIKQLLEKFSLCLAQSEEDGKRLAALGASNVKCLGNIKYDSPPLPADATKINEMSAMIGSRPVWVAASTHKGEEAAIGWVHKQLKATHSSLLTIIIPRHATRGDELVSELKADGLEISQRSKDEKVFDETDIYLADTMGELGIFYRLTEIVFIGGSLVPHGGQNPLEPARLECAIITGLNTFNFIAIQREFEEKKSIITVSNQEELAEKVATLLENKEQTQELITNALELVREKSDILDKTIEDINPYIQQMNKRNAA